MRGSTPPADVGPPVSLAAIQPRRSRIAEEKALAFPVLLTVDEVADLLRTTRKAIYLMAERGQLPGVTRIGRRLLFRNDLLLDWLRQRSAPSLKESRR